MLQKYLKYFLSFCNSLAINPGFWEIFFIRDKTVTKDFLPALLTFLIN